MITDAMIRARRRWFLAAGVAYVWHLAATLLFRQWWEVITEPGWSAVAICVGYAAYYHGRIKQQRVEVDG